MNHNSQRSPTSQKSLLPPLEDNEIRNLAESLCRDILRGNPKVRWESIKGLENAKRLLKEAMVVPIKYPKYFIESLVYYHPGKGFLFIYLSWNMKASPVVSKWRGMYIYTYILAEKVVG